VESAAVSMTAMPESASIGRRWKFRRNLVIFIASQNGVSQRLLADVFDLPHSRIAAIIKEFRTKYAG
jgi:chromosome segregation and condensation protein ScpB